MFRFGICSRHVRDASALHACGSRMLRGRAVVVVVGRGSLRSLSPLTVIAHPVAQGRTATREGATQARAVRLSACWSWSSVGRTEFVVTVAEYGNVHPRTDASPRYEEAAESVAPQATPFVEQRTSLLAEGVVHNAVPNAWPRRLNAGAVLDAAGLPRHRQDYAAAARREWPQVARLVVVAGVAWQVCVWLGADYPPVLAVIVPLVSLRDDPFSAFNFSIARLVGVVAGVVAGICVLQLLRPGVLAVVLVLGLSLVIGIVLRVGDVLNIQVAVSALLVFSSADPESYGLTRLWETGVGAVVTIVLAPLLFPANPLTAARAELQAIAARLTAAVRDTVRLTGAGELAVGSRTAWSGCGAS